MQIILLAAIATVTLILNFRRKLHRIDNTLVRVDKMAAAVAAQSVYIRAMARKTLQMRRSYRHKVSTRDRLYVRCEELIELIKKTNSVDCRLHILDDRRTRADRGWEVMVTHSNFKNLILPEATADYDRQWKIGRRFIVWAVDRERALDKVGAVYPAEQGFLVSKIGPHEDNT